MQEFSSRRSISCSTLWFDHLLVHLLAFFNFLPKCLLFPQIIHSTQLDTPCLQQSRKKKMCYDCLFYEKNILQGVCADVFTRPTLLGFHSNGCNIAVLCFAGHSSNNRNVGTCWAKSLTSFKLYATSAKMLWFHANGHNKSQHCWAQQCCVRLHGP